jgi:hypothetical protein
MWTSRSVSGERREETRRPSHSPARLRPTDAPPGTSTQVMIEDRGFKGMRLSSAAPLLADAVVILHASGEPRPLHARVVWARRAGSEWRAGCRLLAEPSRRPPRRGDPARVREPDARAVRFLVIAGLIGMTALIVYAIVSFASLVGEAAAIGR